VNFTVNQDGTNGVTLKFANGASLSIQSRESSYCTPGHSVELHAWGPAGQHINVYGSHDLLGWVRMDDLPKYIRKVAAWRPR
jgi:hypothetical protein